MVFDYVDYNINYINLYEECDFTSDSGEIKHLKSFALFTVQTALEFVMIFGQPFTDKNQLTGMNQVTTLCFNNS